jgi:hypothetical protein
MHKEDPEVILQFSGELLTHFDAEIVYPERHEVQEANEVH